MRILVLSDSHGCVDPMQQCVELVQPQAILHLGDCARDADRLGRLYPRIPLLGVPGNCDYGSGADILLFGHTHQPLVDRNGDFWVMNPGCIGPSPRRTYGVITLEDGRVDCAALRL